MVQFAEPGHELTLGRQLEQAPISLGETLKQFADFEVIACHRPDLGNELPANVFGQGLLVHFGGQVVPTLRRIFVKRALEEIQGLIDLALELLFAEVKKFGLLAHVYAY